MITAILVAMWLLDAVILAFAWWPPFFPRR
jgi:hypothetical protein